MNLLSDVITYVRRIVKTPNTSVLTDNLIIDYINRFWLMDVDARMQLFDLKTTYKFSSVAGVHQYNAPVYQIAPYPSDSQPGNQSVGYYPVYQGFMGPVYINGIGVPFYTEWYPFRSAFPLYQNSSNPIDTGDGSATYSFTMSSIPMLKGHVDMQGVIALGETESPITGASLNTSVPLTSVNPMVYITALDSANHLWTVTDSGQISSSNENIGFLQATNGTSIQEAGTVNYSTGAVSVTFPATIPSGNDINASSSFYERGMPRGVLFYNNVITVLPPPDVSYVVELTAYLSPAAFLATSDSIPFAYMSEYLARGAARKILSDTGDNEQFLFYEPLFREQEMLVWKRAQRQFTATRTPTIFSQSPGSFGTNGNANGASI